MPARLARALGVTQDLLSFCRGKRLTGAYGGRQSSGACAKHRCPEMIQEMQGLFAGLLESKGGLAMQDSTFRKVYTRDRRGAPLADRLKAGYASVMVKNGFISVSYSIYCSIHIYIYIFVYIICVACIL